MCNKLLDSLLDVCLQFRPCPDRLLKYFSELSFTNYDYIDSRENTNLFLFSGTLTSSQDASMLNTRARASMCNAR